MFCCWTHLYIFKTKFHKLKRRNYDCSILNPFGSCCQFGGKLPILKVEILTTVGLQVNFSNKDNIRPGEYMCCEMTQYEYIEFKGDAFQVPSRSFSNMQHGCLQQAAVPNDQKLLQSGSHFILIM